MIYHLSLVYVDIMSKKLEEKNECSSIKRNSLESTSSSFFFFLEDRIYCFIWIIFISNLFVTV